MSGQDSQIGQVSNEAQNLLATFWQRVLDDIREMNTQQFKSHELPLARIKKIMKLDEEVTMISAEAPVLFAKAAEIFISELSLRAWIHTEENKRRTLQRNDIAMAITKYDQFDFLIDIVPREELKPAKRTDETPRAAMLPDQVQYYFQIAQQHQAALSQQQQQQQQQQAQPQPPPQPAQPATPSGIQQLQIQGLQGNQLLQHSIQLQLAGGGTVPTISIQPQAAGDPGQSASTQQQVILQSMAQQASQETMAQAVAQPQQQHTTTQVFQQVQSPSGELQNIPITLTPQQEQALRLQLQGKQPGQPILIQTGQVEQMAETHQTQDLTDASQQFSAQPIFQIPMNVGGQQIYIQQATSSDTEQE